MTLDASREDQYIAALCHLSLLVPLAGLSLPLVVWLMRRKESAYLRFQAAQSLAYQAAGFAVQLLTNGLQVAVSFSFMAVLVILAILSTSLKASNAFGLAFGFAMFLLWGGTALVLALQCVGGFIYIGLGLWGSLQVIRGRAFRYPILGKFIDRRLNLPTPVLDSQPISA